MTLPDDYLLSLSDTFLQASLQLLLEAAEAAPNRQILILTPNDYHGCLTGQLCRPAYDALMAQAVDRPLAEGGGGSPVEIIKLNAVDRSQMEAA